jgi:tRNA G46 methylase TrmB
MRLEKNPYDLLDYPGHTRPQAHPRRLQTIAWLHGLATPDLAACRVLELGCGDGLQLLWIAGKFPGSCCVGMDLAATGQRSCESALQSGAATFKNRNSEPDSWL